MPLESGSVDCVISNCVLNLVADKDKAVLEIYRILKPGGRVAISDIVLKKPLPDEIRDSKAGWVSCISGAVSFDENRNSLARAGFVDINIFDSNANLNAYREGGGAGCCASDVVEEAAQSCCDRVESVQKVEAAPSCCGTAEREADSVPLKGETYHDQMSDILGQFDFNEFAASAKIFAVKPDDA